MHKSVVFAAVLLAGCALVTLGLERSRTRQERELGARLAALEERLVVLETQPRAEPPTSAAQPASLGELEARLDRLEQAGARRPLAEPVTPVPAASPAGASSDEKSGVRAASTAERAEFEDLLARLAGAGFDLQGPDDEIQRFFELARETGVIDELLSSLEADVAARPADLDARMQLADAYVAKILTLPHGPEQGLWGAKAEEQWREVSERDADHWGANYALGNNYSFYPDVMGKTGEAIRYLERARAIQENLPPSEEHVQTYLSLARMYLRDRHEAEARATLEAGLRFHPGNAELLAELARLGKG